MTSEPQEASTDDKLKQAVRGGVRDLIRTINKEGRMPKPGALPSGGPKGGAQQQVNKAVFEVAISKAVPVAVKEAAATVAEQPKEPPPKQPEKPQPAKAEPAKEQPKETYAQRRQRELEAEKQRKAAEEQARKEKEAAEKAKPKETYAEKRQKELEAEKQQKAAEEQARKEKEAAEKAEPKETYAEKRQKELEAERLQKEAEERAKKEREAAEAALPKESWQEVEARKAQEAEELAAAAAAREEEMAVELDELVPVVAPPSGANVFFRGSGKGQEPWDLLAAGGFIHRSGEPSAQTVVSKLTALFNPTGKGPNDIMAVYRASNSNTIGAPFISAGKLKEDNQGASGPIWQFAIELPSVSEVTVTPAALGLPSLHPDVGDVKIMTDNGQIAGATTVIILHGPLPEATWLTKISATSIKAFYGLAGKPWKRKWRKFDAGQVQLFKETLEKYGVQF